MVAVRQHVVHWCQRNLRPLGFVWRPNGAVRFIGFISQTFTTVPGQNYLLSFWLKLVAGSGTSGGSYEQFQASWNGVTVYAVTNPPVLPWTNAESGHGHRIQCHAALVFETSRTILVSMT